MGLGNRQWRNPCSIPVVVVAPSVAPDPQGLTAYPTETRGRHPATHLDGATNHPGHSTVVGGPVQAAPVAAAVLWQVLPATVLLRVVAAVGQIATFQSL